LEDGLAAACAGTCLEGDLVAATFPGVGLAGYLGAPRRLCESVLRDGRLLSGVPCAASARRRGDSGRGSDCRGLGRKAAGLWGLLPRTDWLNDGGTCGVGGVAPGWGGWVIAYASNEGVVGVWRTDSEDAVGEATLVARAIGRKMPAPGMVVEK
jgi:hypothetical protein